MEARENLKLLQMADERMKIFDQDETISHDLKRVTKEHLEWNFYGCLIGDIKTETESIESRYEIEDGKKIWNFFAGTEVTKVYGMYTNCQANEDEMKNRQDGLISKSFFTELSPVKILPALCWP